MDGSVPATFCCGLGHSKAALLHFAEACSGEEGCLSETRTADYTGAGVRIYYC